MKTGTSVLYSPCKLLKKNSACRIWEGHEFTRAAKSSLKSVALQRPRIAFQNPNEFFSSLLWALTIGMAIGGLPTQRATAQESKCFSIHVRLNGKAVDSPQVIALQTKQGENAASLEGGCSKCRRPCSQRMHLISFSRCRETGFTYPGSQLVSLQVRGTSIWRTKSSGAKSLSRNMPAPEKRVLLFSTSGNPKHKSCKQDVAHLRSPRMKCQINSCATQQGDLQTAH